MHGPRCMVVAALNTAGLTIVVLLLCVGVLWWVPLGGRWGTRCGERLGPSEWSKCWGGGGGMREKDAIPSLGAAASGCSACACAVPAAAVAGGWRGMSASKSRLVVGARNAQGGAIYIYGGQADIRDCSFSGNSAVRSGGGRFMSLGGGCCGRCQCECVPRSRGRRGLSCVEHSRADRRCFAVVCVG